MKLNSKGLMKAVGVLSIIFLAALTSGSVLAATVITGVAFVGSLFAREKAMKGLAFSGAPVPAWIEKSEAEVEAMDYNQRKAYHIAQVQHLIDEKQKELQPQLDEINKLLADGKSLADVKEKMSDMEKSFNSAIEKMNTASIQMLAKGEGSMGTKGGNSIESVLKSKEADIKKMLSRELKSFAFDIETKATQTASDITSGTDFAQMLPGVGQIPHKRTYIQQRVRVVGTNTEYIKYLDQATVVRDAKNVAACGDTTHNTKLTWQTYTLQQQKVRDFIDICIDMLEDYSFVEAEIRNLISSSVALKVDQQLLLGTGTPPELESIDATSSTFSAALSGADYSASIQAPTIIDLIVVMAAQIEYLGSNNFWKADTAYLNPRDLTLVKLYKDAEENYISGETIMRIINNASGNLEVDGVELISNPNVPEGEIYIFDSRQATIYKRRAVTIEMSYENNDNFENETVTVKAYERLNFLVRNVNANAFMHCDDINTSLAALTATT